MRIRCEGAFLCSFLRVFFSFLTFLCFFVWLRFKSFENTKYNSQFKENLFHWKWISKALVSVSYACRGQKSAQNKYLFATDFKLSKLTNGKDIKLCESICLPVYPHSSDFLFVFKHNFCAIFIYFLWPFREHKALNVIPMCFYFADFIRKNYFFFNDFYEHLIGLLFSRCYLDFI